MIKKIVNKLKLAIKKTPFFGTVLVKIARYLRNKKHPFVSSAIYWDERYTSGGNSGSGSYGELAKYKASILNEFLSRNIINNVIEYGCGDGNQLKFINYKEYIGFDVSRNAIEKCQSIFKNDNHKSFKLTDNYNGERAELVLSLDVLYHLVEDEVFDMYMKRLFSSSDKFIIIYSSNYNDNTRVEGIHVHHRKFTDWIEKNTSSWELLEIIKNSLPYQGDNDSGSLADFYIYQKS